MLLNEKDIAVIETKDIPPEVLWAEYYTPFFNKELILQNKLILAEQNKLSLQEKYETLKAAYLTNVKTVVNIAAKRILLTIESDNSFMDFAKIDKREAGQMKWFYFGRNKRVGIDYVSGDGVQGTRQYINTDGTYWAPQLIELATDEVELPTWSPQYSPSVFVDMHNKAMQSLRFSLDDKIEDNVKLILDAGVGAFPPGAIEYAPRVNTALIPTGNLLTYSTGGKLTKDLLKKIYSLIKRLSFKEQPRVIKTMHVPIDAAESIWDWVSVVNSSNAALDRFSYAKDTITPALQEQIEKTGLFMNLFGQPMVLKTNNTLPTGIMYVTTNLPAIEVDFYPENLVPKVRDQQEGSRRFETASLRSFQAIYQPDPYKLNYLKVNYA